MKFGRFEHWFVAFNASILGLFITTGGGEWPRRIIQGIWLLTFLVPHHIGEAIRLQREKARR